MIGDKDKEYRYIFISSAVFFLLFLSFALYYQWEKVYELNLGDNDNYMRYLQFTHWMEYGNWFLQPMPRFNPDDGQIIHWSRVVDIPLALVTQIASIFTNMHSAKTFAMLFVPLTYLFATACCIGYFCHKFFNSNVAEIAIIFTYGSPLIAKFIGGNIDHHNLQIFLFSAIIVSQR